MARSQSVPYHAPLRICVSSRIRLSNGEPMSTDFVQPEATRHANPAPAAQDAPDQTVPAAPAAAAPDLNDPSLYINRELSQLQFNIRVLDQALDESKPILERLKFLLIFSSNMDEFFEIRVA